MQHCGGGKFKKNQKNQFGYKKKSYTSLCNDLPLGLMKHILGEPQKMDQLFQSETGVPLGEFPTYWLPGILEESPSPLIRLMFSRGVMQTQRKRG